jgi:hypothetical protein
MTAQQAWDTYFKALANGTPKQECDELLKVAQALRPVSNKSSGKWYNKGVRW